MSQVWFMPGSFHLEGRLLEGGTALAGVRALPAEAGHGPAMWRGHRQVVG